MRTTSSTRRERLLASTVICGALTLGWAADGHAQTAPAAAPAPASAPAATAVADNGATAVTEFVVTGSRIPQPNLTSIAPVTSVNNAEIKLTGTSRVEDLVNTLPQAVADQGGNLANGATGTADISLRDLGPQRTLVLVDGRRLVPGDPVFPFADINFIPAALIDRVEVDLAGASSVYGSDAVAGVVNFIMKRDFEGVRLDVNYGIYQNNNGNTVSQAANIAKGFTPPTGNVFDGNTVDVTAIIGANSPDGKGNVEGYVSYRHIDPVTQDTRDYSNCNEALNGAGDGFVCAGSSFIPGGRFLIGNKAQTTFVADVTLDTAHPGNFRPRLPTDVYNFAATNYFQRPDERYSGGFFAHYDISKAFQAYSEFMFMDDHTVAQIAPTTVGGGHTYNISCTDPLLSPQEVATICTNAGIDPAAPGASNPDVVILKRNVEGGNRQDNLRHTDYRAVVGLKGDLNDNWHYDVNAQYGVDIYAENYLNDISTTKFKNAIDVVTGPTGAPVCASTLPGPNGAPPTDPLCVPYNIFTPGGVTQAAVNYLNTPGFKEGQTTEQVVSGAVTGNLGDYGLKSPYAHEGIGVAFGAEYRRETLDYRVDQEFLTGDLAGQGGPTLPVAGGFDVKELFAEARVPLVEDAPFAKSLNLDVGYRFAHYSSAGDNSTYKITGDWAITDDIRVRGGFNRAVRAPNILELFNPHVIVLDGNTDNCTGAAPLFTAAQCANTGVTAAQYGHILANPANQYNGLLGGNTALKPESSNTYSVGVVLTPHEFLPGASFSADYFNIKITNVIGPFGTDNIIDQCATTGNPQFCSLIHRAAGTGSLWLGTNIIGAPTSGYTVDLEQNGGFLKTSGIDFAAGYKTHFKDLGMGDFGGIGIDFLGTYTHDYQIFTGIPGAAVLQCVGRFGVTCQGVSSPQSGPLPAFRSKVRLTWTTPLEGFEVSVNWRYIGPSSVDTGNTTNADSRIEAYNYFDLAAQYRFRDRYTLRAGVNNIFDRDPPVIGSGELPGVVGNGNTFSQIYDPLGRFLFVGLTADF
ncbi:MAG: TonB-dependent receptor [Pseudomonadota bacterium]|nr:TonB-dependent receptor [Pseudomonadota bacterium]